MKLIGVFSIAFIIYACNPQDGSMENGNLIFNNNSNTDIFFEIYSNNQDFLSDTLLSGNEQIYRVSGGIKKLITYDANGGSSIKNITIVPEQNNELSAITLRSVVVLNNKDVPVYFHYQRYYEDQRPIDDHWLTYTNENKPVIIRAKESVEINLIDGYKYWGSITTAQKSLPGKNKVLFRVNEKLTSVIL